LQVSHVVIPNRNGKEMNTILLGQLSYNFFYYIMNIIKTMDITFMKLDKFDREILRVLQQDATVSMADLSQQVGLSHTPCWRRVKRMEADGIILGKVTLLNSKKLNLGVSVFIYVTLKNHDGDSLTDFETAVQNIDEIVECHTTSGEKDYLLKVIVESIEEYEFLLKTKLTHLPLVDHLSSTFALKQVKNTTELPIKRQ
jgi:Lrp/AsnC family transcriptional regulator